MKLGIPADELLPIRALRELGQKRADKQLLGEAHPRMRRHLEGAHLDETEAAGGAVGRVELVYAELGAMGVAGHVDQEIAEDAVDEPRRHLAVLQHLRKRRL